jgi:hypothetical protein
VDHLDPLDLPPLVGREPGRVALGRQGEGRGSQPQDVEDQGLVIPFPAPGQEPGLGRPAVGDGRPSRGRPAPVHPTIEDVGQGADLLLLRRVGLEIGGGGENSRQQQRGVDGGELAAPCSPAALHVEEVVVEAVVARGVGLGTLGASGEEAQRGQRAPHRLVPRHQVALERNGIGGQGHAHRGDAGRPILAGLVAHQSVARVRLVEEEAERLLLERGEVVRLLPCHPLDPRPARSQATG